MLIAALEFTLRRSREIVLRTLYAHACRGIRAASESFVLHLKPYAALRRLSV